MTFENTRRLASGAGAFAGAATAQPAAAHHSFAMYDRSHPVVLKGAVQDFQWTNPHSVLTLLGAPVTGGTPSVWTLEMTSPGNLTRLGWSRQVLKPGDALEVEIAPLRDGAHGGALSKAKIIATGHVLSARVASYGPEGGATP